MHNGSCRRSAAELFNRFQKKDKQNGPADPAGKSGAADDGKNPRRTAVVTRATDRQLGELCRNDHKNECSVLNRSPGAAQSYCFRKILELKTRAIQEQGRSRTSTETCWSSAPVTTSVTSAITQRNLVRSSYIGHSIPSLSREKTSAADLKSKR